MTTVSSSNTVFLGWVSGLGKSDEPFLTYSASPVGYLLTFTLSSREDAHTPIIYMKKGVAVDSLLFYRHPCVISFTGSTRSPRLATSSSTCDQAFLTVRPIIIVATYDVAPTCTVYSSVLP